MSKAAVKEEEDKQEEPGSTKSSPAVVRQALSAPSTIPATVKTPPGTFPPLEEKPTAPLASPEKSDEDTSLDDPSWTHSKSPNTSQPHPADAGTISPFTNEEEDEKMDQDGTSSLSDDPAGADAKQEDTPLSSQWPKEDSSSDTLEQADNPFKGFLRLENDAEESQLTSDGEEGTSSDTDEEDTGDPPFTAEPMEVGNSPLPEERENRQPDHTVNNKNPDEDRSRSELPKWIPVPPAVLPETESESKDDFAATTTNCADPNSQFVFSDLASHREKSSLSSCDDTSKTEELPSSDQEQGQRGNVSSATGEEASAVEPSGKRGKGRSMGRGSPEIKRKLKRVSSSEGEPPRKRIADLPDDDTNPWRVDFSGESTWFTTSVL